MLKYEPLTYWNFKMNLAIFQFERNRAFTIYMGSIEILLTEKQTLPIINKPFPIKEIKKNTDQFTCIYKTVNIVNKV